MVILKDETLLLIYLFILDLHSNKVKEIKDFYFKDLVSLNNLNIDNNLINIIEIDSFKNCGIMSELDFSNNELEEINSNIFEKIDVFFIDQNKIKPLTSLSSLKKSSYLDFYFNQI